ncbi:MULTISPECIES: SLATT domain-containing protein [Streptococcus]|uniref:SLATT domain-containing protein n=1 Tax=Streptococcus iners TaxID=3028084 RepID=A0AA96VL50_9STRE|nr:MULTISPECIES: SLATT domain-containing protein [Streptococcus]MCK4024658.1 SLATT domain-containing protein [Streptococcus suis]WNY50416.1 SLATT domain-containing protein [Streptococcus sp. 29887]HEM2749649.1 SLATT domain-containing protein [Streptococcus suis]HEM4989666.1 SLATT domain-containing protein [Streptococcus suis]HEM5227034.1 SLATT domain-containing protein [Streptococcus suis]
MNNYLQISISERINKKLNSLNIVRNARIAAGKRLAGYAALWDVLFLIMNIISATMLIYSLIQNETETRLVISATFSLYSLIIQYYCSTQNYKERAIKFHYHQIQLERFITELQKLFLFRVSHAEKLRRYEEIMNSYHVCLQGEENHSSVDRFCEDNKKYIESKNFRENKFYHYINIDTVVMYSQFLIIIIFIVLYFYAGSEATNETSI